MQTVGVRELKNRLSHFLRAVREGEVIEVTDRGRVVAQLTPPGRPADESPALAGLRRLAERGLLTLGAPRQTEDVPQLARPPGLADGSTARWLDDERGER